MSQNDERNPPGLRIEIVSTGASESEAAAVIAGVEQFLGDTAPPAPPDGPKLRPWARAALDEGIAARQVSGYAWGHAPR